MHCLPETPPPHLQEEVTQPAKILFLHNKIYYMVHTIHAIIIVQNLYRGGGQRVHLTFGTCDYSVILDAEQAGGTINVATCERTRQVALVFLIIFCEGQDTLSRSIIRFFRQAMVINIEDMICLPVNMCFYISI